MSPQTSLQPDSADFTHQIQTAVEGLREVLLTTLWRQWAALGAMAAAPAVAGTIVDPEALVLMSLTMSVGAQGDLRLRDLVAGWGILNSHLLSVQRMGNLAKDYPTPVRQSLLGATVQVWATRGKDHRWTGLAADRPPLRYRDEKARSVETRVHQPAALVLRLRTALGVGLRPDVLTFLLGMQGQPQGIRAIAGATRYTQAPLRRAMTEMVAADIVERVGAEGPDTFTLDRRRWSVFLKLPRALPLWPSWHDLFLAAIALIDLRADADGSLGRTAFSALGRDVLHQHRRVLTLASCPTPILTSAGDGTAAVLAATGCLTRHIQSLD